MKKLIILSFIFFTSHCCSQTGWILQPSFTSKNLYDFKRSAVGNCYIASDSGTVFKGNNTAGNWQVYNFNDPLLNNINFKYVLGGNNDDWWVVGQQTGFGFVSGYSDSVHKISTGSQVTLEAFSLVAGASFYTASLAAGTGGNFYIKDGTLWRKDTAATVKSGGRNINCSMGIIFVGDNGLILKADSIGITHSNGEKIKWRKIICPTNKNLNYVTRAGTSFLAVGDDGTIIKSGNNGETWTLEQSPVNEDLYGCSLGYANLICGANGTILRKYDTASGIWYQQPSPTSEDLYFIFALGYSEYICGGKNGVHLKTSDGGGARKYLSPQVFFEGFYNPNSNSLSYGDTVTATIRSSVPPYTALGTGKTYLNSTGNPHVAGCEYGPMILDSVPYYIQLNHRNSIEVWSSTPQVFNSFHRLTYSFITAANKAYAGNQKQVDISPSRFAMYSGDVNQDGNVDVLDVGLTDNDAFNFLSGYINTDVNGDNVVDVNDLAIIDNNAFNFVSKVRP